MGIVRLKSDQLAQPPLHHFMTPHSFSQQRRFIEQVTIIGALTQTLIEEVERL